MKTIYKKITVVLLLSFICQVLIFGIFYKYVYIRRVLTEINSQESARKEIMHEVVIRVQKCIRLEKQSEKYLQELTDKYNIPFELKDMEGNTIAQTVSKANLNFTIQEEAIIKVGYKNTYFLTGYFPARLDIVKYNVKDRNVRILVLLFILASSVVVIIYIYKSIANPLRNLNKAINNLNYGNTIIKIPYYAEDELGSLCRSLEKMGERLKKSEDDQQELIQAMSHDLKTPLTSIIGYSKRLAEDKVKEEKKQEYYDIIFNKANDLKSLLAELEDYTDINFPEKFEFSVVNCKEFFTEISEQLLKEANIKGVQITILDYLPEDLYAMLNTSRLKRVFLNLVQNSFKYVEGDCKIKLSGFKKGNEVVFSILDNGKGVPKEQLSKIFDRFYRVEGSRSREKGGTGLGLSICKNIIEKHGGNIYAKNTEEGFCVIFSIPTTKLGAVV